MSCYFCCPAGCQAYPYPAHTHPHDHAHTHSHNEEHTHSHNDNCACSAPANDSFSDEEEIDNFDLYTPLRIVDELVASYGVGLRYLIEWEDLPFGAISVESANGLGRDGKKLLEDYEARKKRILSGEEQPFDQEAWRKEMKAWNAHSRAGKERIIEGLKKERLERQN